MAAERIVLDPLDEATGEPLEIVQRLDGASLLSHAYPGPEFDQVLASSISLEGERSAGRHPKNRQLPFKLRVAEPPNLAQTKNLVAYPSFEFDPVGTAQATGWTLIGGAFLPNQPLSTMVVDGGYAGGRAWEIRTNGNGANAGADYRITRTFTAGETYTFSLWVRLSAGFAANLLTARIVSSDTTTVVGTNITPTGAWAQVTVTATIQQTVPYITLVIFDNATALNPCSWQIDAVQLTQTPTAVRYCDGDTIGCRWLGTPHASQSIREASGGPLIRRIVSDLEKKVVKFANEGGTIRRYLPQGGDPVTLDVVDATLNTSADLAWMLYNRGEVDLSFTVRPYGRLPEREANYADDFSSGSLGAYSFDIGIPLGEPYASVVRSEPSLVSYWRLGETAGVVAADSKDSNPGTYTGGVTLNQTGALTAEADKSALFDGSNDYVNVPDAPNLRSPGAFTIEAWVKPTDRLGNYTIASKSDTVGDRTFEWFLNVTAGTIQFFVGGIGGFNSLGAVPTGVWTHLAVTYDGISVRQYINGVLDGSPSAFGPYAGANAQPLRWGARSSDAFFKGGLDEVAFYNGVLSANRIARHYSNGINNALGVSGGQLVPSTASEKRLYLTDKVYADAQLTMKFHTGASVASGFPGLTAQRIGTDDYLLGQVVVQGATSFLTIHKSEGGTFTQLGAGAGFTIAANTDYWLRMRDEGNKITVELFTAAPTATSTPAQTLTYTLTGADATKFGFGNTGNVGIRIGSIPATDWRFDDLSIEPNVHVERTLPVLNFAVPPNLVKGSAPALGRLVVTDLQNVDQAAVYWGQRSRYTDSSADAALFYEAETRTPLNSAFTTAGTAPASGGGNNVMRSSPLGGTGSYSDVLSTQASGGGAHHRHVGDYLVLARVMANASAVGTITAAFDWCDGVDFRKHTVNAGWQLPGPGAWYWADLGQVHLTKAIAGAQGWLGKVVAKSTSGAATETLDVDCYMLIPVAEGSGRAYGVTQYANPPSFTVRDEFDQTAGNLTGKTAPAGGNWNGVGSANDYTIDTVGHTAQRSAVSDAGQVGRYSPVGASQAAVVAQVDVKTDTNIGGGDSLKLGLLARYVDVNNWIAVWLLSNSLGWRFQLTRRLASNLYTPSTVLTPWVGAGAWVTLRVFIDTRGRVLAWAFPTGGSGGALLQYGPDGTLATGGALQTGQVGIYDEKFGTVAATRNYDNFQSFTPTIDAAAFAGQPLELRSDAALRADPTGVYRPRVSRYEGDLLKLPASGRDNRTLEMIVKAFRNDPLTMSDSGIDDVQAQLFVTPRVLVAPEP